MNLVGINLEENRSDVKNKTQKKRKKKQTEYKRFQVIFLPFILNKKENSKLKKIIEKDFRLLDRFKKANVYKLSSLLPKAVTANKGKPPKAHFLLWKRRP